MHRRAFSLVELLVVIAIVALLIALLLPWLRGTTHEAKRVKCMSNMRQAAGSLISYAVDNDSFFPQAPWGRWEPSDIAMGETGGFKAGPGDYDHRDVFRDYTSTQLNDFLKCPLADAWWFQEEGPGNRWDIDQYNMGQHARVSTTYSFFYGGKSINPNNASHKSRWPRDQAMEAIDDRFKPQGQDLEFDVLMSDYTKAIGWGGDHLLTTHQPIGGQKAEGNAAFDNHASRYEPGEQATANFARTDGSVLPYWLSFESSQDGTFTSMRGYLLPADLGY